MHAYRTHTCGALRLADAGQHERLSGWVHRKRDHGQLLFVDLRDHYGITQCVIDVSSPLFAAADALRLESVITVTGKVVARLPRGSQLRVGPVKDGWYPVAYGNGYSSDGWVYRGAIGR